MKKKKQPLPAKEEQGVNFIHPEKQEAKKKEQPLAVKKKEGVGFNHPEKQEVKEKEQPLPAKEDKSQIVAGNTQSPEKVSPLVEAEDDTSPETDTSTSEENTSQTLTEEIQSSEIKSAPVGTKKDEVTATDTSVPEEKTTQSSSKDIQSPEVVSPPVETKNSVSPATETSALQESTTQFSSEVIQIHEVVSPPVEAEDKILPETETSAPEENTSQFSGEDTQNSETSSPLVETETSTPEENTSQFSSEDIQSPETASPPVETAESPLPEADTSTLKAEVEKSIETVLEDNSPKPAQKIPQPKPELKKTGTKGPLAGIRILDLTRLYPGPLATMLMAELGAEVIKIEDRISADDMRTYPPYIDEESAGYLAVNRSKRSLALKFNEERGQEVFFQLVKTADLVIEQFRPGVLDRVGMGYYEAIKANPRIIYVSLTGYGQYGPYAKRAGHDINYMGYSGIISTTGAEKAGLVLPGVQIADIAGGAYMAVVAALSALWARERSGAGQRVDVSMLDSVLPLMSLQMAHYWAMGKELPPWQLPLSGGMPFYGVYKCGDGKYIALGAIEPKFWKQFCELVDKPEWVSRYYSREDDAEKLKIELARLFRSRTRDAWIELVGKADLCLSPVLDMSEVENDPHLQARGMIVEYDHPQHGKIRGIGMPLKFSRQEKQAPTPPPALGEHTLEILYELGYEDKDIRDMLRKGAIYIHKKK